MANLKSNATPEHFVPVCTAPRNRGLINLNVHLRSFGLDARYVSGKDEATIRVPPEAKIPADYHARRWAEKHPETALQFNT